MILNPHDFGFISNFSLPTQKALGQNQHVTITLLSLAPVQTTKAKKNTYIHYSPRFPPPPLSLSLYIFGCLNHKPLAPKNLSIV